MSNGKSDIRFGIVAVEKGFITEAQIGEAVSVQMKEDLAGLQHRLLGEILMDLGFMTPAQIEDVLQEMEQQRLSN